MSKSKLFQCWKIKLVEKPIIFSYSIKNRIYMITSYDRKIKLNKIVLDKSK